MMWFSLPKETCLLTTLHHSNEWIMSTPLIYLAFSAPAELRWCLVNVKLIKLIYTPIIRVYI